MDHLDLGNVIPPAVLGVDIGQKRDPTALCLVEADTATDRPVFVTRRLERLPLGTPYPQVAARLIQLVDNLRARDRDAIRAAVFDQTRALPYGFQQAAGDRSVVCRIDVTGVGRPVLDLLTKPLRERDVRIEAMTFTHGDRLTHADGEWRLGKGYLVSRLQVLLQELRIKLPSDDPEAAALVSELENYQIRIPTDGNEKYGAFSVGSHDDLATALGLAVLRDPAPWSRPASAEDIRRVMEGDFYDGNEDPWGDWRA